MHDVPIVTAATGSTSKSGAQYILVMHESLYMKDLDHSLINPNQLRHHRTVVQDNPYSDEPMHITSADGEFMACLQSQGTTVYLDTWSLTDRDLENLPHIQITSWHQWNPHNVEFPGTSHAAQEEMESRNIAKASTYCFAGERDSHEPN